MKRSGKAGSPCNWIRCRRQAAQLWAGSFTARGDMRKLCRICERAVELEPRSIAANHRLGDVYAQTGQV